MQVDAWDVEAVQLLLGVMYREIRNYIFYNFKKLQRFVEVFVTDTMIKNLDVL